MASGRIVGLEPQDQKVCLFKLILGTAKKADSLLLGFRRFRISEGAGYEDI
jgi:hypothetical protein